MVEFIHRRGDLAGDSAFRTSDRARQGIQAHHTARERRGRDFESEVPVEWHGLVHGRPWQLAGRVDLLSREKRPPVVEEIKSVDAFWNGQADPVHLAQVKIYAAMLAMNGDWPQVEVRLTYLRIDSGRETTIPFLHDRSTLEEFFHRTLEEWSHWCESHSLRLDRRNTRLATLGFPFETFRAGQRALSRSVYRAIRDRKHLFIEAATGLGKTMAVLYPAVRALALPEAGQVRFLTAKTSGRRAATEALNRLRQSVPDLNALILAARPSLCFKSGLCDPRACEFAIGYHDRRKTALKTLLERGMADPAALREIGETHRVCPHALASDAVPWVDVVVGDFNHAFDPDASLAPASANDVLLVDEAHNLVDRSREIHSATITKRLLESPPRPGKARHANGMAKSLARMAREFLNLSDWPRASTAPPLRASHRDSFIADGIPEGFASRVRSLFARTESHLASLPPGSPMEDWIEIWSALRRWVRALEAKDNSCAVMVSPDESSVRIFCSDASPRLKRDLERFRSAIFFSATLSPLEEMRQALGGSPADQVMIFASPFNPGQLGIQTSPIALTHNRRAETLPATAHCVNLHLHQVEGNHLVFCPSFSYARSLAPLLETIDLQLQNPGATPGERTAQLDWFRQGPRNTLLAVLGGNFAEGIDLPGTVLAGATIIGIGLPGLSLERDLVALAHPGGFDHAYLVPGLQRVAQAAGRLIRSESDCGSLLLIDARYREERIRRLLPSWWIWPDRDTASPSPILTGTASRSSTASGSAALASGSKASNSMRPSECSTIAVQLSTQSPQL
jgi:DNA excision repair protein ERCC-2